MFDRGLIIYNELPVEVNNTDSINIFKRNLTLVVKNSDK